MEKINISGYVDSSIVDGPGVRFAVYTQGCIHECPGCHNPNTWDFQERQLVTVDELIETIEAESLGKKVTISGGDPLFQIDGVYALCIKLKQLGYNIWLYTGYTLEEIENDSKLVKILTTIDTLVDGRFEQDLKDFTLDYRGSSNQNIIDCTKLK